MSEEAWQDTENAEILFHLLPSDFSRRKLRYFVCGFVRCRLHWVNSDDEEVLELAESIADDEPNVDPDHWVSTWQGLRELWGPDPAGQHAFLLALTVGDDTLDEAQWAFVDADDAEYALGCELLREVFGNPFRPLDFAPWRTGTAVALARTMYESQDFGAMPILADALQDAGCDNAEVLSHCRDASQVHARGCWVVDGVLGLS
jgi:hypothetical protein